MKGAVYAIVHVDSGTHYIGRSTQIEGRWRRHWTDLNCGRHLSPRLQADWLKYGSSAFEFKVLEVCNPIDLSAKERDWLMRLPLVYNDMKPTNQDNGRFLEHSAESRLKMSSAQKARGYKPSKEHLALMQQRRRETVGWVVSDETRAKMRGRKGRPMTEEHKEKIRQSNLSRYYHPLSEEHKLKLRIAHAGRKLSAEHRAKISEGNRRRWARTKRRKK